MHTVGMGVEQPQKNVDEKLQKELKKLKEIIKGLSKENEALHAKIGELEAGANAETEEAVEKK